jgi:hypothetical protein
VVVVVAVELTQIAQLITLQALVGLVLSFFVTQTLSNLLSVLD